MSEPLQSEPSAEVLADTSGAPVPTLSKASRTHYQGFMGRVGAQLGAWLGLRGARNLAAGIALQGASRLFEPSVGAPLGPPVAIVEPPPALVDLVRSLLDASSGEFTTILAGLNPASIARVDAACGDGWTSSALSLRELIHEQTEGEDTRSCLRILDSKLLQLFRGDGAPVHDLRADPSGIFGRAADGSLPQTIHKILELRRLKRIDIEDLASRHEVSSNNALELHTSPEQAFRRMLAAIDQAQDFVHVAFFIWKGRRGQQLADALIAKAQSGVKVRVVLDEAGAWLGTKPAEFKKLVARLAEGGVEVICNRIVDAQRPTTLLGRPDHRKTVVIDGKLAFIGGVNIGDEYVDQWHDLVLESRGDLVHQIHAEWFLSWLGLGGYVDPGASDEAIQSRYFPEVGSVGDTRAKVTQVIPGVSTEIAASIRQLIGRAEISIDIENPYITEASIHAALEEALGRKCLVRIIIPEKNNHFFCDLIARPAFKRMIEAGAEIYAYPGMAHGKVMVVDAKHVSVGTANLDDLSLRQISELNVVVDDPEFAQNTIANVFEVDLAKSRRLSVEDITLLQRTLGTTGRVLAPLL